MLLNNIQKLLHIKEAILLLFCGYKQKEVSSILNKSEKATESLIIRTKKLKLFCQRIYWRNYFMSKLKKERLDPILRMHSLINKNQDYLKKFFI